MVVNEINKEAKDHRRKHLEISGKQSLLLPQMKIFCFHGYFLFLVEFGINFMMNFFALSFINIFNGNVCYV